MREDLANGRYTGDAAAALAIHMKLLQARQMRDALANGRHIVDVSTGLDIYVKLLQVRRMRDALANGGRIDHATAAAEIRTGGHPNNWHISVLGPCHDSPSYLQSQEVGPWPGRDRHRRRKVQDRPSPC